MLSGDVKEKGPIETKINDLLRTALNPASHIEVINESHKHASGYDSHFKLILISEVFEGKSLIQRHRLVNALFKEELSSGRIHALSISAKTPSQFQLDQSVPLSPSCLGGSKK